MLTLVNFLQLDYWHETLDVKKERSQGRKVPEENLHGRNDKIIVL